ncbi:PTS system maltose and glucose-specific transporter subunit IICB [Enterobacter hormaechei]|nr:PTS system maltose and glucose-specific transporter subunit IICB [Enterobacter hormaechei]CZY97851.1 PTS system maltose and glucose-specific transporter subunit IICB [Enterobacter hormaechei]VAG85944.1 PTS system maltose and glucose-specific transporter subunit IICB [Enterobacter hormaechei]
MTTKAAQKISLWEFFQQLGKTFMLPVALLSFCGIRLGIGSSLSSHDVITLIPFLGNPVLQAIFIWRLLSLLTKWLDVGLKCGNFCYVAAIRFVMCNELTSFRGNFMSHPCPTTKTLRSSFQFRNLPLYAFPYHQHNHHRSDCKIYQVRTSFIGQQANLKIS